MENLDLLRCDLIRAVMDADTALLARLESKLDDKTQRIQSDSKIKENSKINRNYYYTYLPQKDSIVETTIGKNVTHSHILKDEFLKIVSILPNLIDSKNYLHVDGVFFNKSPYTHSRIRVVIRICIELGLLKKAPLLSGKIYTVICDKIKFTIFAEKAWKEKSKLLVNDFIDV